MRFYDRLRLIIDDYEYRSVRVVFLRDYPGLPTPHGRVNARRGDEMDLPRWQARILEREGVVEVRDRLIDVDTINMYHYQEKKKASPKALSQLPQDFYLKVRDLIRKIDETIREDPRRVNLVLLQDRDIIERNLYDLAQTRLLKIIRLAVTGGEEFRERLTPEESLIYGSVSDVSEAWRKYIQSIFRGDPSE